MKRRVIIIVVILLFLAAAGYCFGTSRNTFNGKQPFVTTLSPEEMKKDFDYLVNTLAVNQPVIKSNPLKYRKTVQDIYEKIKSPMTVENFYWTINDLFVALKDGHTHLDFIGTNSIELPELKWTRDGLIVFEDKFGYKKGDKIISIGGKTPEEILKSMNSLIPSETEGWVKANINRISMEMYLKHLNLLDKDNRVSIKHQRENMDLMDVMSLTNPNNSIIESFKAAVNKRNSKVIYWSVDKNHNAGIITINECSAGKKFTDAFEGFFKEVNKESIGNIAVDLRENIGGSDIIINKFLSYINVKKYYGLYSELRSEIINNPRNYRNPDSVPTFNGKIYLLTSNATFSAGTDFAVILQGNKIAKVIGQPTGNIASFYGNAKSDTLPNSKLPFQYSTTRYKAPVPEGEQNNPIKPDYKLEYTRDDILNGIDPWIEKLNELCK